MIMPAGLGLKAHEFRPWGMKVSVETDVDCIQDSLKTLYSSFPTANGVRPSNDQAAFPDIHYSITHRGDGNGSGGLFYILRGGEAVFQTGQRDALLPYLEWFINNDIMDRLSHYFQFHAAVVSQNGHGFIFPGPSGSGKTTLVLGLLMNGFRYLSDEFALIDPKTLHVVPFPRNIYVYENEKGYASVIALTQTGGSRTSDLSFHESSFSIFCHIPDDRKGEACPVRYMIFPKYQPGGKPRLEKITKGQALLRLLDSSLNFKDHVGSFIDPLIGLLKTIDCFSLTTGNLQTTVDLLLDLPDHVR